eukprot:TRINITY_DN30859_c0_g1_i1.p2 TRINITY_DN30859_c0_g1~~TRINITY_DN30859_c0_g1_i1.p2  ORF type:complete len:189 (-),score=14.11 TRINITY_DN30859_c0_g1_i1:209-775(-)
MLRKRKNINLTESAVTATLRRLLSSARAVRETRQADGSRARGVYAPVEHAVKFRTAVRPESVVDEHAHAVLDLFRELAEENSDNPEYDPFLYPGEVCDLLEERKHIKLPMSKVSSALGRLVSLARLIRGITTEGRSIFAPPAEPEKARPHKAAFDPDIRLDRTDVLATPPMRAAACVAATAIAVSLRD